MKTMKNTTHIEGYVYEHKLEKKVSGEKAKNPGTEYITGILKIATDDECTNIVEVHFSYVTEVTKKGTANDTFKLLQAIIDNKICNVMAHGKDNAGMVRIDSALDLNEWYDRENGSLISVKRNEGGFLHQTNELAADEKQRARFEVDIVINGCRRLEENVEKDLPERMIVKGAVFNFRNALLPMEFTVLNPNAMNYFESLEASNKNPVFTKIRGLQVSKTVVKSVEETSAWGDVSIRETKSSSRDFVINWAQQDPYEWDDESTILASELSEAMANREIYLAELKQRQDEYQASKGNAIKSSAGSATKKGAYNF